MVSRVAAPVVALLALAVLAPVVRAQETPRFEKRLLDEEVRYIFTFQWHRIVPHNARVRGWTITPSHFLNNQLDPVWLAE
jgi:hypothetical protein